MNAWVLALISSVTGTAGDVLMSHGMKRRGEIDALNARAAGSVVAAFFTDPWMIASVLCQAGAFFSFVALLSIADLTFSVPATALSFVFKIVLSKYVLREKVGWRRWCGTLLVVAGVVALSV